MPNNSRISRLRLWRPPRGDNAWSTPQSDALVLLTTHHYDPCFRPAVADRNVLRVRPDFVGKRLDRLDHSALGEGIFGSIRGAGKSLFRLELPWLMPPKSVA